MTKSRTSAETSAPAGFTFKGVDLSGICHDGARPRRAMILTSDEVSNAFLPLAELASVGR